MSVARRRRKSSEQTQTVKASSIRVGPTKRADTSRQADVQDPFMGSGTILATPYSMGSLDKLYERSNVLLQCIHAYVNNIASYGFEIVPIEEGREVDEEEKAQLQSFMDYPNVDESLKSIYKKHVFNYEKYGFAFYEVIRNRNRGVSLLRHASSFSIRIISTDIDPIAVRHTIIRGGRETTITEFRRFHRYVMRKGGKSVYFKEFGDPRDMNFKTGKYDTELRSRGRGKPKIPPENRATELLHNRQYSEDAYGIPRWINQLPSILGSREVEEVNLRYFEDNTVPPMLLSVAGGRLTRQSFRELKQLLENEGIGKDRQNKILLLEAVPESSGVDEKGSASIKVDKLSDARQSDALFGKYDEANIAKVRSSFRLPPVIIGQSQDVTYATANVSAFVAETQVFAPERSGHDEFLNKKLINHPQGLGLRTVKLKSRGPSITNPEQIMKSLTALNVMGGVTPRSSIDLANKSLQLNLPQYPEEGQEDYEDWTDRPVAFVLKGRDPGWDDNPDSTHLEQGQKTAENKATEASGDTSPSAPEHGQE